MYRLGYSDTRAMVDLTSADGKVNVRLGDVAIPNYFVPNQYHSREGDTYDLGAQAQLTVARYRAGADYATIYAKSRFAGVCTSLEPAAAEPGEPVREQHYNGETAPKQATAGQVAYRCASSAGPRIAYVYAKTSLFDGFWQVSMLASYVAPAGRVAQARTFLYHLSDTLKLSPRWIEHQKQMDKDALVYQQQRQQQRRRAISLEAAQFEMKMQSMRDQVGAFERRQAAQAKQVEDFTNALNGITPTTDPLGNRHDVSTGPKANYWINGMGQVVNADTSPGPGWQPLKQRN